VNHVGEAVAMVVATDRYIAEDAVERIRVQWEPLPAVVGLPAAFAAEHAVHPDVPDNVAAHMVQSVGEAHAAIDAAPYTMELALHVERSASMPLEGKGVYARWDADDRSLRMYSSTQTSTSVRFAIAAKLGIPVDRVEVVTPDVGGGFGVKIMHPWPEEVLVPWAAIRLGREVKWVEDRREHFISSAHERAQEHTVRVGFDADGRILGLDVRFLHDNGAYTPYGIIVPIISSTQLLGPYKLGSYRVEFHSLYTNTVLVTPYRGAGRAHGCFVMERVMDAIADHRGLDRAVVRERNMIQPDEMPYDQGLIFQDGRPLIYDTGDFPASLHKALALVDYDSLRREQAKGREEGRLLGIGIATAVEPGGSNLAYGMLISGPSQLLSGQGEAARVRLETDGTATVFTGGLDSGQGHATALAQIVADELGLNVKQVRVPTTFDSASHPYVMTSGVYSNKFHGHDTVAAIGAARKVREKLLQRAGAQLEANVADLELNDGRIFIRGAPQKGITIAQVASRAYWSLADEQPDGEPGLEALYYYSNPLANRPDDKKRVRVQLGFASAAHVAVVEVDPETFEIKILRYVVIHDCGRQINPGIVEGQVHGATAHGIAAALFEEFTYDENGQLLTTSFMDYLKPTAADLPDIEGDRLETPSPLTLLGTKGVGEGGAVVAPAAIASAVEDALLPLGIHISALPITPSRLFEAVSSGMKLYEKRK